MLGQVVQASGATFVTRYAITCCRADAVPICVRTQHVIARPAGAWVEVHGVLLQAGGTLRLAVRSLRDVAPPIDPFLYR